MIYPDAQSGRPAHNPEEGQMFSDKTITKAEKYLHDHPDHVVQKDDRIWTVKQYKVYALKAGGYSCTCPHGQNTPQAVCYHAACVDLRLSELGEAPEELGGPEAADETLLGVVSPKDEEDYDWGSIQIELSDDSGASEKASETSEEGEDRDA